MKRSAKGPKSGVRWKKKTTVFFHAETRKVAVLLIIDGEAVESEMDIDQARDLYKRLGEALSVFEN